MKFPNDRFETYFVQIENRQRPSEIMPKTVLFRSQQENGFQLPINS